MTSDRAAPGWRPSQGTVLGRYELLRLIGEGGMGRVFEARHLDLGKRVAIKTLNERYAALADAESRFLREGRVAAQVRHPNITDVYDVGLEQGHPYLVMELLEGETLAAVLRREAVLSAERTADLLLPVVAAMATAHDEHIVHRDLKPDNVFLARGRRGLTPKVLDFGISKLSEGMDGTAITGSGALLGTPHYLSPEQAAGDPKVDARSDQYSLGVVLYQCVTGRRPNEGAPLLSLIQRTIHGDFPAPREVNPQIPAAFEAVILRAMARQPERRFASARALGRALLPFAGLAVQAEVAAELLGKSLEIEEGPAPAVLPAAWPVSTLGASAHEAVGIGGRSRRRSSAVIVALAGFAAISAGVAYLVATRGSAGAPSAPVPLSARVEIAQHDLRPRAAPLPLEPEPVAAPSLDVVLPAGEQGPPEAPSGRAGREAELDFAELLSGRWRRQASTESCRAAREAWSVVLGQGGATAPRARAALSELAECQVPSSLGKGLQKPRQGRDPSPPTTKTPAAAEPGTTPLPADDPESGFLDLDGR